MEHKGYSAKITFDEDANTFHGVVIDLRDVITFESDNVEDLIQEFRNSVDDYLDFCASRGEDPEKPYSGTLSLRLDPELHRVLSTTSANYNLSLNKFIIKILENSLQVHPSVALEGWKDWKRFQDQMIDDKLGESLEAYAKPSISGLEAVQALAAVVATDAYVKLSDEETKTLADLEGYLSNQVLFHHYSKDNFQELLNQLFETQKQQTKEQSAKPPE